MVTAEAVTAKKLKIKFGNQRIEAVTVTKTSDSARNDNGNFNSRASDIQNMKPKPMVLGVKKRGPSFMVEGQPEKKRKMERSVIQQCSSLLRSLINSPSGWVFKVPVDPVALNIPDYFSIIKNPMDLGTIKSKLEKNMYSGTGEFAADVRLTFSNAMIYNPPTNYVHKMADKLNKIFETRWKSLEGKWNRENLNTGEGNFLNGRAKETTDTRQNCPETPPLRNAVLPKRSKTSEDKAIRTPSNARTGAVQVKLYKPVENCAHNALEQNYKGTSSGGRHAFGSVEVKPSSSPVLSRCGDCGRGACQCSLCVPSDSAHASSDISYERSLSRDNHACSTDASRLECQGKHTSTSQMSKSDPDSDGCVSALDDENVCPSSQLMASSTDAASGEGWKPPIFDVQLSPTKVLRAAMLKHRFADTILKAQHKTLLEHGDKSDPLKLQQEKERLEKRQRQERALIAAQIRAAEAASRKREEIELKRQREKEREAARIALQKMEKTAEIEQNLEILKELEKLCGGNLSYNCPYREKGSGERMGEIEAAHFGSPLEQLGLFIKDDVLDEDERLNWDGEEEGEIFL